MHGPARELQRRLEALRVRVEELSQLQTLVQLPNDHDITARQWSVIRSQLTVAEASLLGRLKSAGRTHLPRAHEAQGARELNALLGQIELDLARAYTFFDTYMDILTQRHPATLGWLLAGCDVLAWDSINRDHPALAIVEPPLVYCDRGFGASTMREGVMLAPRSPNPMPIIQIPYSRMREKYNLTSILHEVGHEAMVRLGLDSMLPRALRTALSQANASKTLQEYFSLWSSEIGPDFWAFCGSGVAAAGGLKEILALPSSHAFRVTWTDRHPPPYLRALLAFDWCRRAWGADTVEQWERQWHLYYPLSSAPREVRALMREAVAVIPVVTRVLLSTRFRVLDGRRIPDLFDLPALNPARLSGMAREAARGRVLLRDLPPSAHLAVFRLVKDEGHLSEEMLDRLMTNWLLDLGAANHNPRSRPAKKEDHYVVATRSIQFQ